MMKKKMMTPAMKKKMQKVMAKYGKKSLHSGKGGPVVTNQKQAVAIAYSVAKKRAKR